MPRAGHPLIAAHRPHTASHLRGESLERQPVVRGGQRTRRRCGHSLCRWLPEQDFDRLVEAPLQNLLERRKRYRASVRHALARRQMEAVNRIQKKLRTDALVEIPALTAEAVERG